MENLELAIAQIKEELPGMTLLESEPLSQHCSFRIGGPARAIAVPSDVTSLSRICCVLKEHELAPLMLGNGTNILFPDEGLQDVLLISTEKLTKLFLLPDGAIYAEAGVSLSRLASFAQQNGLKGLEFASGIPGTLGGGCRMNAGAYGGELKDVITRVLYLDEDLSLRETEDPGFSYRHSRFSDTGCVVLAASVSLHEDEEAAIRERMRSLMERRRASQPLDLPSAGSTFKRPAGGFAAALIDQAGLKGCAVGGAMVSPKHAGFVVNRGGAAFEDVIRLMEHIQETVFRTSGIELEPEVKIIR